VVPLLSPVTVSLVALELLASDSAPELVLS
jgi:hypothetical protein